MLELAASGAKVLHLRCVEYARRFDLPIHVRSSFSPKTGTFVVSDSSAPEGDDVEQPIIAGVAHDMGDAKVTVVGVPDKPGMAAAIFRAVADAEVNIDMIVQNVSAAATGRTDVTFTLPAGRRSAGAAGAARRSRTTSGSRTCVYDDGIAKISLVGAGMRSHPGVSATLLRRAVRRRHQRRDDLDVGDPHLRRHPRRLRTRGGAGRPHGVRPRRRRRGRVYGGTGR